jgi:hypothetical protein
MEIISTYYPEQGEEDGTLVLVDQSKQQYFAMPVYLTRALFNLIDTIPASKSWESFAGRLHDVILMARLGAHANRDRSSFRYKLILHRNERREFAKLDRKTGEWKTTVRNVMLKDIMLKATMNGLRDGKPCLILSLDHED